MLEDSFGYLWIGSIESGLVKINLKTNQSEIFSTRGIKNLKISSNEIYHIFEDSKKQLWIGTINGGLLCYNRKENNFYTYSSSDHEPYSLLSNSITRITEDRQGNIWISSHDGVYLLDYKKNLFSFYGKSQSSKDLFDGKRVACFYETNEKNVWIGTDLGGLYFFNRANNTFKKYTTINGLLSNSIIDIEPETDGKIWLATWGGGISLFDPKTEHFKNYTPNTNISLNYANIKGILKDGNYLWIASHGRGVNILDIKNNKFYNRENPSKQFPFDMNLPLWGNDIIKDKQGNIWILTTLGLFRWDGQKLHEYYYKEADSLSLSGNIVYCLLQDADENIWVGTNGLDLYDRKNDCFIRQNLIYKGMPESVRSITQDKKKRFWLGSKDGLYLFDPKDSVLRQFTILDGLQGNQFIDRASIATTNGEIFIGGSNGFNVFEPLTITPDTSLPKTYISSMLIWNRNNINRDKDNQTINLIHQKSKKLSYQDSRTIMFDYVAINFHATQRIEYAYKLENFDDSWHYVGNDRRATYTNLQPGIYTFRVKSANKDGLWNNESSEITFTIDSPWWMKWWFRALVISSVMSIITLIVYLRIRNIKKYNSTLQQMVSERTQELEIANFELEEQSIEVLNQFDKLKENQLVIKMRNDELNETLKMKDKLLSIIAHDLKAPLSSVIGFSQLLKEKVNKNIAKEKVTHYADLINESSIKLLEKLNNLLDWARAQSNNIKYTPENVNIALIVRDVISLLSDTAYSKEINIVADFKITHTALADSRMLSTIIRNLISNSIKFTPRGGLIAVLAEEQAQQIMITVSDSGMGMTKEQLEKLWIDEFHQTTLGTENEKGTGLGLRICKEFIEINKGDLFVTSTPHKGTQFTISLPIGAEIKNTISLTNNENKPNKTARKLILVIDDNYEMVEYISDLFDQTHKIETAYTGLEGFNKAIEMIPDIIITDIHMPEMDGKELCVALKKEHITSHIPIIIVSAQVDLDEERQMLELGANDFIKKPFNKELLKLKVNALIENRNEYRNYLKKEILISPLQNIKTESKDESLLRKVNEIVEANMKAPDLSVEFLAREIGVSRAQLFRKFKAILGYSPVEYIRSVQTTKSCTDA
ncbi:MAG: response regulator [Bacteroidales bacterium]|nr:response regulator [Bacteroidales bacterium]